MTRAAISSAGCMMPPAKSNERTAASDHHRQSHPPSIAMPQPLPPNSQPATLTASAPPSVPADSATTQAVLNRYRHRTPLSRPQIVAVVEALQALLRVHGEPARSSAPYAALLRLLKAHAHPSPLGATFAQLQGGLLQIRARSALQRDGVLPDSLQRAIKSGFVSGFDPHTVNEIPAAQQWSTLAETRKLEQLRHARAIALARERELARDNQRARDWHDRVFDVRRAHQLHGDTPRPLNRDTLLHERRRALSVRAERVEKTIRDAFAKHESGVQPLELREAALLESRLRQIRLLNLQDQVRTTIWREEEDTVRTSRSSHRSRSRLLKQLQRDFERQERVRVRQIEIEDRDSRRKRQLFLNGCMEHANKFRNYHRDVVRRGVKATTKAMVKYHEDMEKHASRSEREAERARIQKLKDDDEEGYLELVRKTKNTRLLELLNQTDKYLQDLGAVVKEERVKSGIVAYDNRGHQDGEPAKRSYYNTAHAIKEEVTEQSSLLVGGTLKEYQLHGIQWMVSLYNNRLNGILADEMGLGKTIQTLGLITHLMEKKDNAGPYLIIVPLSTVSNWELEFAKWAPALTVVVFKGDKKARRLLYENVIAKNNFNVCLVTYEYVVRGKNLLKRVQWQHLIIDEGHRIKNHESRLSIVLQTYYTSRNRLLLTGTPLQNSLTELWALLNFLLPNVFKSAESFESWFAAPFAQMGVGNIVSTEQQAQLTEEESLLIIRRLHQVLRPFLLRRLKSDVLRMGEQLPDKSEHVLLCDMSAWQWFMYKKIVKSEKLLFTDSHGRQRYDKLSNPAVQLRKCVNHPYLFYSDHSNLMMDTPALWRSAGKFDMLDACILKFLRTGHRLLIFNQMTKVVDLQERLLTYRGIPFYRLDGNTSPDDRKTMVADFNAPESEIDVFLLTTRAGGLGVNLQTADTVIIFDSDWNPSMDKQAQDRAHRIGQRKEVLVLRMITAKSIEEDVLERASFKRGLEQKIIGAGKFDEQSKDSERQEMLRELLRVEEAGSDGETDEGLQTEEEVNRLIARSEEEFEIFQQVDQERRAEILNKPKLVLEHEIPEWSSKIPPELLAKSKKSGAGKWGNNVGDGFDRSTLYHAPRKRKAAQNVSYDFDQLTEKQYMKIMEASERGDIATLEQSVRAVGRRKKRRKAMEDNESRESSVVHGAEKRHRSGSRKNGSSSRSRNDERRKDSSKDNDSSMADSEGLPPLPPIKRNRTASKTQLGAANDDMMLTEDDDDEDIDDQIRVDDDEDDADDDDGDDEDDEDVEFNDIEIDEDDDDEDERMTVVKRPRESSVDRRNRDTSDSEAVSSLMKGRATRGSLAASESSADGRKLPRKKRVRLVSTAEKEAQDSALRSSAQSPSIGMGYDSDDDAMVENRRRGSRNSSAATPSASPPGRRIVEDDDEDDNVVEDDGRQDATASESEALDTPNGVGSLERRQFAKAAADQESFRSMQLSEDADATADEEAEDGEIREEGELSDAVLPPAIVVAPHPIDVNGTGLSDGMEGIIGDDDEAVRTSRVPRKRVVDSPGRFAVVNGGSGDAAQTESEAEEEGEIMESS